MDIEAIKRRISELEPQVASLWVAAIAANDRLKQSEAYIAYVSSREFADDEFCRARWHAAWNEKQRLEMILNTAQTQNQ